MTKEYKPDGLVMTITGPSGSGKSTLEARLEKDHGFHRVISTTTRPMRPGEEDGKNYHYVTEAEFRSLEEHGKMAESVEFHGNLYGVQTEHLREAMADGKPVVIVVEPEGLKQIRETCKENNWTLHAIFVTGPIPMLADRIMRREMQEGGNIKRGMERVQNLIQKEALWQNEVDYDTLIWEFTAETENAVISAALNVYQDWVRMWVNRSIKDVMTHVGVGVG